MNKSKRILGSLIVITLAVSMAACGKKKELEPAEVVTATPTPEATPTPKVTATPTPTPTPTPEMANKTIYANDNVNVRASAASDGEIVGSLQPGEGVKALENPKDGWIHIQLDGADGYVKEEYMTETAPADAGTDGAAASDTAQADTSSASTGTTADASANVNDKGDLCGHRYRGGYHREQHHHQVGYRRQQQSLCPGRAEYQWNQHRRVSHNLLL